QIRVFVRAERAAPLGGGDAVTQRLKTANGFPPVVLRTGRRRKPGPEILEGSGRPERGERDTRRAPASMRVVPAIRRRELDGAAAFAADGVAVDHHAASAVKKRPDAVRSAP